MPKPLLLRGGTVQDGLGSPGRTADVLVSGGVIARVGRIAAPPAAEVIDCTGLTVAPGFVDAHTHSDLVPLLPGPRPFKLRQGVTTEIVGNCGISYAPLDPAAAVAMVGLFGPPADDVPVGASTFADLLDRLDAAGPTNNLVPLVGHHALRLTANGAGNALRPGALDRMCTLAAEAFEAGAWGLSTGLIYPPGCYGDTDEVAALAAVAARYGGVYATHLRDEGDRLEEAVAEAVAIARRSGARLQVSHCKAAGSANHGKSANLLAALDAARLDGVDVHGDQYPYLATSTVLSSLLPSAAAAGGPDELVRRLTDPAERSALRALAEQGGGLIGKARPADVTVIAHRDTSVVGRTVAELGADPFETVCRLVAADPAATMVATMMAPDDVRRIMASPLIGVGSDSDWPVGLGHPRIWGTFPHLLGRYVRELGVLTWPEAIRKATSLTTRQFGLLGRGAVLPGWIADLVVFDPATIGHPGTYAEPDLPVTGVHTVLLAGTAVVSGGTFTGVCAGQVLRARD